MKYRWKKVENCFDGAKTYEYELPVTGGELLACLHGWEVRENHKFRRPVFSAKKDGIEMKGILNSRVIKINYTEKGWEKEKEKVEKWLESTWAEGRSE